MSDEAKYPLCRHNKPAHMTTAYDTDNYLRQFCRCYKLETGEPEACDYWEWDPNWEAPHPEWPWCLKHQAYSAKYISRTALNPDRSFYRCPKGKDMPERCSFFAWEDELNLSESFFEAVARYMAGGNTPPASPSKELPSLGPSTPHRSAQHEVPWSSSSKILVNTLANAYLSVNYDTPSKPRSKRHLRPNDEESDDFELSGDDTSEFKKRLFMEKLDSLDQKLAETNKALAYERKKRKQLELEVQSLKKA
jgi:hypothetical protein